MKKLIVLGGIGATAVVSFALGLGMATARPPARAPGVTIVPVTATSRNLEPADVAAAGAPLVLAAPPTATTSRLNTPLALVAAAPSTSTATSTPRPAATATPTSAPTATRPPATNTPRPATNTPRPYPTSPPQPVASAPPGGANVYAFPMDGAQVVSTLSEGRSAVVTGRTKDSQWLAVFVNGRNGWLKASSVRVAGEVKFADVVAFSTPTAVPAARVCYRTGATCRDGTHSNATGSGACSHHGGVAQWLETCTP